mgnify:CR=1 FL=1
MQTGSRRAGFDTQLVQRIGHMGRDINSVRVGVPDVGGGFGPKANLYPEEYAVAMAAATRWNRRNLSKTKVLL